MNYTAETLCKACLFDNQTLLSIGAKVDYGLDTNPNLFGVYQEKIRTGKVSLKELIKHAGNGPELSKLLGQKVVTVWDRI